MTRENEILLVALGGLAAAFGLIWLANNNAANATPGDVPASYPVSTSPTKYTGATYNIGGLPAPFTAPAAGNTIFNINGSSSTDTNAAPPSPSPTSATGGVTPGCGCNSSVTTYYGSPAAQSSSFADLLAAMKQAIPPVQNLANSPPVSSTTPKASPTPASSWAYPGLALSNPNWVQQVLTVRQQFVNNSITWGAAARSLG